MATNSPHKDNHTSIFLGVGLVLLSVGSLAIWYIAKKLGLEQEAQKFSFIAIICGIVAVIATYLTQIISGINALVQLLTHRHDDQNRGNHDPSQ